MQLGREAWKVEGERAAGALWGAVTHEEVSEARGRVLWHWELKSYCACWLCFVFLQRRKGTHMCSYTSGKRFFECWHAGHACITRAAALTPGNKACCCGSAGDCPLGGDAGCCCCSGWHRRAAGSRQQGAVQSRKLIHRPGGCGCRGCWPCTAATSARVQFAAQPVPHAVCRLEADTLAAPGRRGLLRLGTSVFVQGFQQACTNPTSDAGKLALSGVLCVAWPAGG